MVVSSAQFLEADVDHDPIQPGGKGPLRVKPPYLCEQLYEDLLSDILGEVVVSHDPIRGTQDGQPVKLEENFQPGQVSILTPKYGLPLPWRRQLTIHPSCDTNSLIKYYP